MHSCMPPESFRWDDLRLFLAAYRTRSLSRAAAQLGLNQSTLSRRLAGFEDDLGTRLFDRPPEGLLPTAAAEALVTAAERAEAASHDVLRTVAGQEQRLEGEVRVAAGDGMALYALAPTLPRFHAVHPDVRVTLIVGNEIADLTRREADIAVRFVRPQRGDLVAKRLGRGGYAVYAAAAHFPPRQQRQQHRFEDLDWIGWDEQTLGHLPEERWLLQVATRIPSCATSMSTRIALAAAGEGVLALPEGLGDSLPGFVRLDTPPVPLQTEIWLVTHRALREVPRINAVWDYIEDTFASLYRPR